MVAHVDARRRFRRACAALSQLSALDQVVLDAYYGREPSNHPLGQLAAVTVLTEKAKKRNRARASREMHESVEVTVRWLVAATSPDARATLAQIRLEAESLLQAARRSYALARSAVSQG